MTITKVWLQDQIDSATKLKENAEKNNERIELATSEGALFAYQKCLAELTKPPQKTEPRKKDVNVEKGYETIVTYYMNRYDFKEKYPDEKIRMQKANEIAQKCMTDQVQQRLSS